MEKKTTSFRFTMEFIDIINAWSFVTNKDKATLLEEAFQLYAKHNKEINDKVTLIMDQMKE